MKNFVQPGDNITITAPVGGCTKGVGVLVGGLFGVAANTVDAGAEVEIATTGVFDLAKTSALEIAVGDVVYWDSANKVVNKTALDQQVVGVATTAAANPSSTVNVRLGLALSVIASEPAAGDVVTIAAPSGGTTEGVGVKVGSLFGVALATAAEAADVDIRVEGVVSIAKTSALAISVGDLLYWDDTNKVVNKTSSGNTLVGYAVSAAANPSDTVQMKLTP